MATDLTPIKTRVAIDDMLNERFADMAYGWNEKRGHYNLEAYARQAVERLMRELRPLSGYWMGNESFEPFEVEQAAKVLALVEEAPYNGWSLTTLIKTLRRIK